MFNSCWWISDNKPWQVKQDFTVKLPKLTVLVHNSHSDRSARSCFRWIFLCVSRKMCDSYSHGSFHDIFFWFSCQQRWHTTVHQTAAVIAKGAICHATRHKWIYLWDSVEKQCLKHITSTQIPVKSLSITDRLINEFPKWWFCLSQFHFKGNRHYGNQGEARWVEALSWLLFTLGAEHSPFAGMKRLGWVGSCRTFLWSLPPLTGSCLWWGTASLADTAVKETWPFTHTYTRGVKLY